MYSGLILVEQHSATHHKHSFQHSIICSFCERSHVILQSTQLKGTHKCGWNNPEIYLCCHCYQYYTKEHRWSVPEEFYGAIRRVKDNVLGPPPVSSLLAADRLPASSTEKLDSPPRPPGLASGTGAFSISPPPHNT